jgi:hypothetical protein
MTILAGGGIIAVPETHSASQTPDRGFFPRKKVEAFIRSAARIALDKLRFLGRGNRWEVARIKAHDENLELFSGIERNGTERPCQILKNQRAKVLTIIIDQSQNNRFLDEIFSKPNWLSGLI